MTLDEIKELSGYMLATMADVSTPDAIDSPGARFLTTVRDKYVENRDAFRSDDEDIVSAAMDKLILTDAGTDLGTVPHPTDEMWRVFTDLAVWQNDYYEPELFGTIEWDDISNVPQVALGEVAQYLAHALRDADNGQPTQDPES